MIEKTSLGAIRDPRDLVPEYDRKLAAIDQVHKDYMDMKEKVKVESSVAGEHGRHDIFSGHEYLRPDTMKIHLLKSAWWAAYRWCNMSHIATAKDKKKFEQDMVSPPPFTVENLVATFGPYLADPRDHILRGLAEAFVQLDDAYKSHSKVKIGVKGLPKRVIINSAKSEWGRAWGWERAENVINALTLYNGHGLVDRDILWEIQKEEIKSWMGMEFRFFKNGNLHIYFNQDACLQINRALAEYYGAVLPDVEPDKSDMKPDPNKTAVSKDLQYYPTPEKVADHVLEQISMHGVKKILDPSCGCGRLMDAVDRSVDAYHRNLYIPIGQKSPPRPKVFGVEYDKGRVKQSREKGHAVLWGNFLETNYNQEFDLIVMNPPFYGKHYLKHIDKALEALAEGGTLISILPATAHYDHKKLPTRYEWKDLPPGSFAESGVRVPTGYAIWRK